MKPITQKNLAEFKPDYGDYAERVEAIAAGIGVESPVENKDYEAALRTWNRESAIGFTDAELGIIALIYSVAKENKRFDNDIYLNPDHGGNTAEHPVFMGAAFDHFKKQAGFGPETFDAGSDESLWLAKLSQRVHGMIAIHDVGELVDVSYAEQQRVGASSKEPKEEEMVGPFQFRLAAYALSQGDPDIYRDAIADLKVSALTAKQKYFAQAVEGKITGDQFIEKFGEVLGEQITEAERVMRGKKIAPEYQAAMDSLQSLFDGGEKGLGLAGQLFNLTDRFEGTAHHSRYLGKAAKDFAEQTPEPDAQRQLFNRLFGNQSTSFMLANSQLVVDEIKYPQKGIIPAFEALKNEPEETREAATKLVRAAAATIVRASIPMLQKAPPFVDIDGNDEKEPPVNPERDGQEASFISRLDVQRQLRDASLGKLKGRQGHVTAVEGIMDTKSLIALLDKTATAIENGTYTPEGKPGAIFPIGTGTELPDVLKLTPEDLKASAQKYPLEAASDFKHLQHQGQAVRL